MNAETLHAIDTFYLRIFQKNLLTEIRRARFAFKQHLKQSASLAIAKELLPTFSQNYAEIAERLVPLVDMLGDLLNNLEESPFHGSMQPDDGGIINTTATESTGEVIARLDAAELEILDVLNGVGECLTALPRSIVSWDDCGLLKVHVMLKRLSERPCYNLNVPLDFHTHPFLVADYFTKQNHDGWTGGQWPHYLIDEIMPLELVPLIEDLWMEIEVRANGYASWRTREEDRFGKLCVRYMPSGSSG